MPNMIVLTETQLSDIFFNHQKINYDLLFLNREKEDSPTADEITEAVEIDAFEFSNLIGNQIPVSWLVSDFMKRL